MADHKIKISGDFKSVTQGFKNLSDTISQVSQKRLKFQVDDSQLRDLVSNLSKDMEDHHNKLQKRAQDLTENITQSYKELQKAYEESTDPQQVENLENEFKTLSSQLGDVNNQLESIKKSKKAISTLTIKGNTKEIVQQVSSLAETLGQVTGKEYKLNLDKKEIKSFTQSLSKDIGQQQDKLKKGTEVLTKLTIRAYKDLQSAYEKGTDPRRVDQLRQRFERLNKALRQNVDQMKSLNLSQQAMGPGGGFLSKIPGLGGGGMPGRMPSLPGAGGMLGKLGMMGRFLGPAGMIVGGALGALSATWAMGAKRRELAPDNLQLMGQGTREGFLEPMRESGIRMGFRPTDTIRQATQLQRATGGPVGLPRPELGGFTQLEEMQKTSRGFGVSTDEVTGLVGQLRNTGLKGGESLKKLQDIFAQGTAMGVERARLPDFAREQVGLFESQAQIGTSTFKGIEALNSLLSRNRFFSDNPQRTLTVQRGLENAFGQKQGPGAIAAFDVINQMTGGKMSPFQQIRIKRMGLLKGMEELQKGGFIKDVDQGIRGFVEGLGQLKLGQKINVKDLKKGTEQFTAMALAMQDVMGVEDVTLVEEMLEALSRDKQVTKDWLESKIDAAKKSEDIMEKVMKSQDMAMEKLAGKLEEAELDVGDITNAITNALSGVMDKLPSIISDGIQKAISDSISSVGDWFKEKMNPFDFGGMKSKFEQETKESGQSGAQELIKKFGNKDAALKAAREDLLKTGQIGLKLGSGEEGAVIESMMKDKELTEKINKKKAVFEELLGRKVPLREIMSAQPEGVPTGDPRDEQQNSQIRQEEEDKLKGRKPSTSGKSEEGEGSDKFPDVKALITPMNRLKGSLDRLADVMDQAPSRGGGTTSPRPTSTGPTKSSTRIGS